MQLRWLAVAPLLVLTGCVGELTAAAALIFSMTAAAWLLSRDRQRAALQSAEHMRLALASGEPRILEDRYRKELALVDAGEAVSIERQWMARFQLAGLLIAEWRLDEAREVYEQAGNDPLRPDLAAITQFGRHELALLTEPVDDDRLAAIRRDRENTLSRAPRALGADVDRAWDALEGLCLERLGRHREAIAALERGLPAVEFNPARVIYLFHLGQAFEALGDLERASEHYGAAQQAFPGTRLANEAESRLKALGPGADQFRRMLPESPQD